MRSRLFLFITSFLFSFGALAQQDTSSSKPSYFFSLHTGGLLARHTQGSSFTTSFVHGVRFKRFAFGAGIGYDAFAEWRTMPLFGRINYDFASLAAHTFYIQLEGGYSKAWFPGVDENIYTMDEDGGMFYHPQVGYRINAGEIKVYLSAGYKVQYINYSQESRWWGPGYPSNHFTIEHIFERVSVQIGFGLK